MQRPEQKRSEEKKNILIVREAQTFQLDRELHITRSHHVLHFEFGELCIESKLLHDASVLSSSQTAGFLRSFTIIHDIIQYDNPF
jgi:hypothetical protein